MSFVEIGLESQAGSIIRQIEARNVERTQLENLILSQSCDRGCRNNLITNKTQEIERLQERLNTVQDEIIFVETPFTTTKNDNTLRNALIFGGIVLLLI